MPARTWFALAAVLLLAAGAEARAADEPGICIGERRVLRSAVLGEERSLLIHLPESYASSAYRYPVLYLLDADFEFLHTVGIVEFLSGTGQIPEMVIVGVPNTVRSRDLTPESSDKEETAFWPAVGGADRFREFFRDELMPFVDSTYRTVPYRIVRGQSFGGLFAIHDDMSSRPTFNAYLTSSPGVGWNHGVLIERAPKFFERGASRPLYVAASGRDFPGNLDGIRRFAAILDSLLSDDASWEYEFFESEDHYSLVHQATYHGLRFLYRGWAVPDSVAARGAFADYERHYENLSKRYGYPIPIPLEEVIRLGNRLLRARRYDEGIRVLERNIDLYPDQPRSYWHVGDAYLLSGKPAKARPFMLRALEKAREINAPEIGEYEKSLAELDARLH